MSMPSDDDAPMAPVALAEVAAPEVEQLHVADAVVDSSDTGVQLAENNVHVATDVAALPLAEATATIDAAMTGISGPVADTLAAAQPPAWGASDVAALPAAEATCAIAWPVAASVPVEALGASLAVSPDGTVLEAVAVPVADERVSTVGAQMVLLHESSQPIEAAGGVSRASTGGGGAKHPWTKAEDDLLSSLVDVSDDKEKRWTAIAAQMACGRTGKQCRERWCVRTRPVANRNLACARTHPLRTAATPRARHAHVPPLTPLAWPPRPCAVQGVTTCRWG